MVSLVAWLAVGYRKQYDVKLQIRNKQLEETRDFLANIIEGSGEAIVTLDAQGSVSSWNRAAEEIFGWKASEIIGHTIRRLLPDDPEIVEERNRVGRLVRGGRTVRDFQTTRRRKDGSRIAVRITWAPLYGPTGDFSGVVGIVLDVTAEAEMKQRLVEQERLAAVGEMAAQLAHEVRNPLAGIRGACEMVMRGNIEAHVREEVGKEVVQQIDRLNRTVEELLQFARPRVVERVPTDLGELINRVLSVLQEDPRVSTIALTREFAEHLPLVAVDPSRIEQVFYNLLLNASQMMSFEGTISIATAATNGGVTVTVRDTGPGIPPGLADDIFKPFVTTRTSGTGLGLAIVKKIIEAHAGTVNACTRATGGAEFQIYLPFKPNGPCSAPPS
jgi:two-component system sensor histidine kinase HydH